MAEMMIYDRACIAVRECKRVDEVLEILSRTAAVRAYAEQAKNRQLELDATEIRLRATRRLGELLLVIIDDGFIEAGSKTNGAPANEKQLLRQVAAKCGCTESLARLAIKSAKPTEQQYEKLVAGWRAECLQRGTISLRLLPPDPPSPPRKPSASDLEYERERAREAQLKATLAAQVYISEITLAEIMVGEIDAYIESSESDVKLLKALRKFLGGIDQTLAAIQQPLSIAEVISESNLRRILKSVGRLPRNEDAVGDPSAHPASTA